MKNTIKKERENLGMTQAELAKKSGVARTIVFHRNAQWTNH